MAKEKKQTKQPVRRRKQWHSEDRILLSTTNYLLFAIGVFLILVGFVVLAAEKLVLASFLLVLGYCVFIPLSIFWGIGGEESVEQRLAEAGARVE